MASFWDMACSSKLWFAVSLLLSLVNPIASRVHAQRTSAAQQAAELQFDLARSLANAGEHEAAAREFDRGLTLQRTASTATPEQTQAALQSLRAYTQSRSDLPGMNQIARRLERAERMAPAPTPMFAPNTAPGARANDDRRQLETNPYHRSQSQRSASSGTQVSPQPAAPSPPAARATRQRSDASFQLHAPSARRARARAAWWEQMTLSADELLVPAEWTAALANARGYSPTWPQLAMVWPELLVPEGWEGPIQGSFAAMLLIDTELLVPPGW